MVVGLGEGEVRKGGWLRKRVWARGVVSVEEDRKRRGGRVRKRVEEGEEGMGGVLSSFLMLMTLSLFQVLTAKHRWWPSPT